MDFARELKNLFSIKMRLILSKSIFRTVIARNTTSNVLFKNYELLTYILTLLFDQFFYVSGNSRKHMKLSWFLD